MKLSQVIKDKIKDLTFNYYRGYELQLDKLCNYLGLKCLEVEFNDPEVSGKIFNKEGQFIIYVNSKHSITRKRFTAAHEIGHYLSAQYDSHSKEQLSKEGFKDYAVSYRKEGIISEAETEANEIAAEMLMPEKQVKEFLDAGMSIEKMAELFFVSPVAMTIRVERLIYNSGYYLL